TAVVAARAEGGDPLLRTVIDGVRICGQARVPRQRGVVGTAADGLVVVSARSAAALARDPGLAVVVGVGRKAAPAAGHRDDAGRGDQLRDDGAAGLRIGEEDRVE